MNAMAAMKAGGPTAGISRWIVRGRRVSTRQGQYPVAQMDSQQLASYNAQRRRQRKPPARTWAPKEG